MPLPVAPCHVNVWLRQDGNGYGDCLRPDPLGMERLHPGYPIVRVVVTYLHPDHIRLAT